MKTQPISDYPAINTVPAWVEAYGLYMRFTGALADAEALSLALQKEWLNSLERDRTQSDAGRIAHAQALLAGGQVESHADKAIQCNARIASLKRAVVAQRVALGRVVGELSAKAAARFTDEHKARTRRVIAALVELHEANQSEAELRDGIEALGYSQRLPGLRFGIVDRLEVNPFEIYGGYAPAWYADAMAYVQTPAQRDEAAAVADATVRRARAARVTGNEPA